MRRSWHQAEVELTSASLTADAVALVEIGMAVMLLVGVFVVRRGNVRAHKYIQSSMVLLNLPIVLIWMVPRYVARVLPDLPGEIGGPVYLIPTIMLVVGATAQALGVYILLVAGTDWVPERLRFRDYKRWMRSELVLWWSVVGLGLATYLVWYGPSGLRSTENYPSEPFVIHIGPGGVPD